MTSFIGGGYEVNLDNRKLRTPAGTVFKVPNEALATAVAQEWQAQQDLIKRSSMHLVGGVEVIVNTFRMNILQTTFSIACYIQ